MDITARKEQEAALIHARDEAAAVRATLIDAIEVLPEAFALFDADDRLTLCNARYAQWFTDSARSEDVVGMTFADVVRVSIARGEPVPERFRDDVEGYVAERVRQHLNPGPGPREVNLGDGRWLQVTERRTSRGGVVGVRSDVTERKDIERRMTMEHAVTRLLAESQEVAETMPKAIRIICETLGLDCGARWRVDDWSAAVHCVDAWGPAAGEVARFVALSHGETSPFSEAGPIHHALATGRPVWVSDLRCERATARVAAAQHAGLRSAIVLPIRRAGRTQDVMEFYLRRAVAPDRTLLQIFESIGLQMGQFVERMKAQEQLRQLAHFDTLTGLPNRALFRALLDRALARAKRRSTLLALLFIDLDGFKQINDRYGHAAGDELLVGFTERLRGCLRRSDDLAHRGGEGRRAARLGGDEFVVMFDHIASRAEITPIAERILAAVAEPFTLSAGPGRVTASIGVALYPDDGDGAESLIDAADRAMYDAKESGRNACRFNSAGTLAAAGGR